MTTDDTYNGWTNRETWACHLHLSNSEWLYNGAISVIGPHRGSDAADTLKSWCDELVEEDRDGLDEGRPGEGTITMMDREVGSWWRVNWQEVADAFMEE
jgi:hypothetical protein